MAKIRRASAVGGTPVEVFPKPICADRAPTSGDSEYPEGQVWIDRILLDAYFLAGFSSGTPQWINAGGGGGSFSSLTVSGATVLGGALTQTGGAVSLTSTGASTYNSGTGAFGISTDAAATAVSIATGAAAKTAILGSQTVGSTLTLNQVDDVGVAITDGTQTANIIVGTGSPNTSVTAPQGSVFLNVAGGADTILYVNTNGATAWTALTST